MGGGGREGEGGGGGGGGWRGGRAGRTVGQKQRHQRESSEPKELNVSYRNIGIHSQFRALSRQELNDHIPKALLFSVNNRVFGIWSLNLRRPSM